VYFLALPSKIFKHSPHFFRAFFNMRGENQDHHFAGAITMTSLGKAIRQLSMKALALVSLTAAAWGQSTAETQAWNTAVLDDCETADNSSSIGTQWKPSLDTDRGGTSSLNWFSTESTIGVEGFIEPIPGSMGPGTAGMVLPLGPDGSEFDISGWDGIQLTIRNEGAPLLLRIHTAEINNGDHFAVMIPESAKFETLKFSFRELGQVMSAQQPWSGKSVSAIELVSFGWTTQQFGWELDEIGFYRNDSSR
jgi:hypothetical protein